MTNERERGAFLSVMGVLFVILAISNFTKAIQYAHDPNVGGIVIFGVRHQGVIPNLILGPLMGLIIAAYAYGLFGLKSWVAPLSLVYAFYVPVNLTLFWYWHGSGEHKRSLSFIIVYLAFALTGSVGTALYLAYHRDKLA